MKARLLGTLLVSGLLAPSLASADESRYTDREAWDFSLATEYRGTYSATYNGVIPFVQNLVVDATFTADQKAVLDGAEKLFVERALHDTVLDCAYKNATKNLPESRAKLKEQLISALVYRSLGGLFFPGTSYATRVWDEGDTVALGWIGSFFNTSHPSPGYSDRHYFYVAVNSDYLGSTSSYWAANDSEYWSGVLAHEYLHNLGYDHPTGYPGSFIREYENCIMSDGAGSDRGSEYDIDAVRR